MPAGDGMCWLGSWFLDSGGPLSISGLHVWQLDHINLIFKLQHAVPTTACKLFLGWGGGGGGVCAPCEEHAASGMHAGRMPGPKEVSATTGSPACERRFCQRWR